MEKKNNEVAVQVSKPMYIVMFEKAIGDIAADLKMAAKIYCDAIKKDPGAREQFLKYYPKNSVFFNKLERLDNGLIEQEVFFLDGIVGEKVCSLTIERQRDFLKSGANLLTVNGDEEKVVKVFPSELTARQTHQLIDSKGKMRTIDEQKAWIAAQNTRKYIEKKNTEPVAKKTNPVQIVKPKFEIKNKMLFVTGDMSFTADQLWAILKKMM